MTKIINVFDNGRAAAKKEMPKDRLLSWYR